MITITSFCIAMFAFGGIAGTISAFNYYKRDI